jgi:hypothetical protein
MLAALVSTPACSTTTQSNGTTQVQPVGQPPIGGITDSALVPVGVVVGFSVTSSDSTSGVATVDDSSVCSLVPTSEQGTFVLIGRSPGKTTLHASAGSADPVTMPVAVVQQSAMP